MKKTKLILFIFSVSIFISSLATSGLYKWVDDNGVAHFSDSPPIDGDLRIKTKSVPKHKDGAPEVRYLEIEGNGNNSNSNVPSIEKGKSEKHKTAQVELYVTGWCPYCKMARNFFLSKGVPFKEYDIDKDQTAANRKMQLNKGKGVPLAVINGKIILGFSKEVYESALKEAP